MIIRSILENGSENAHDRVTAAMPVDSPSLRKPWGNAAFRAISANGGYA